MPQQLETAGDFDGPVTVVDHLRGSVVPEWTARNLFRSVPMGAVKSDRGMLDEMERKRLLLRGRSDCRFLEPEEFCRLLVSRRHLVRADDGSADVHGVLEPETGVRFLIERERLFG